MEKLAIIAHIVGNFGLILILMFFIPGARKYARLLEEAGHWRRAQDYHLLANGFWGMVCFLAGFITVVGVFQGNSNLIYPTIVFWLLAFFVWWVSLGNHFLTQRQPA